MFNVNIGDRIEIISKYNFDKELDVVIYNVNNIELYRTKFLFGKNVIYWISINQLNNIKLDILYENDIIYTYTNINNDFVYVTCGDLYYMDLIEKLVISLLNVSKQKIIVYGINCKIPFDYPNLIKREFNTLIKTPHDKWFWKQQVCIESLKENYNNYVWLDGDIIVNFNIDSISKYFSEIENYPIGEIHVQDEQIYNRNGNIELLGEKICEHFGINRKILKKDLHACFFVYNQNCKWFFEEIINTYHSIYDQGLYDKLLVWNDESLHNFMHSKYGFTKTLPLSNLALLCNHNKYNSNPKVLRIFYGYWNEDAPNNFGEPFGWSYVPENKEQILYFHENKNLEDANQMIQFIKMKTNNSFNDSKWFFIDKYKIHNFELKKSNTELDKEYNEIPLFEKEEYPIYNNKVVVDIGAGIGFFERYCYLKNVSKIICFESNEKKYEILKLNAHKNTILFNTDAIDNYNINYLFDSNLISEIDLLKIDSKGKEKEILNNINESNLMKIKKISIKWYDFLKYNENVQHNILEYYSIRGFNCLVQSDRIYIHKIIK